LNLNLITYYSQSSIEEPFYGPRVNLMLGSQNSGGQGVGIIFWQYWNRGLADDWALIHTFRNKVNCSAMLSGASL
jgi:hypothetical protein